MTFKSGFVSIIGKPNAGKSTLLNGLINKKISIINSKPNLTRNRILGIYNDKSHQIVFSDTPGILTPKYTLQEKMLKESISTTVDSDLILIMVDIKDKKIDDEIINKIINRDIEENKLNNCKNNNDTDKKTKYLLLINKIDLIEDQDELLELLKFWKNEIKNLNHQPIELIEISSKFKTNFSYLLKRIKYYLPIHPPYYDKELISDRPMRFFIEEIIREKIFSLYHNEIPYSSQVKITEYKELDNIVKINADIYLERESQKQILIGKKGSALKKLGIESRSSIQKFLKKHVYIKTHIKIQKNWRKDKKYIEKII